MVKSKRPEGTRREFLRTTAGLAGAGGLIVMEPARVFGSQANSRINVGILGTGGRGRYDGRNIVKTGKAQVVALADYFDFQLTEPAQAFGVPEDRCFSGLEGFRQVLDLEEVDAVILAEPPFFRPYHFERAIAAGKHVFAEKPIAVDPWGCRKFLEMGKKAEQEQLTVVAGLQLRYDPSRREIADKIKNGAIGELILGHSQRMGGDLWRRERPSHFTERDHQIRHWLYYAWAGGDFIVEMHIHNLDVFNWFTGMLPASACGSGGRTVRTDVGDILDHLDVIYEYPNGFHLSHTGTQISKGFRGTESRIVGSEGFYDSETGLTSSDGEVFEQTRTVDMSEEEMLQFVDSILGTGPYLNNSEYVATSTFTCVLGRTAAYNGQKITWRDLWDSNQKIEFMESQL